MASCLQGIALSCGGASDLSTAMSRSSLSFGDSPFPESAAKALFTPSPSDDTSTSRPSHPSAREPLASFPVSLLHEAFIKFLSDRQIGVWLFASFHSIRLDNFINSVASVKSVATL